MADVNVAFGAQDEGVAAAARKLAVDMAMLERVSTRTGGAGMAAAKAAQMVGKATIGSVAGLMKFGAIGAGIAALAGGWMAAAKGAEAYAKYDKQAQHQLDVAAAKADNLWAKIGHMAGGDGPAKPLTSIAGAISDALGDDPHLQELARQKLNKESQKALDLALARDATERQFLENLYAENEAYDQLVEKLKTLKEAGTISGPAFGQQMRVNREAHEKRVEGLNQGYTHASEEERKRKAREEQEAKDAGDDQMYAAYKRQVADREALSVLMAEAGIRELMAKEGDKEATKAAERARVQLDLAQKIAEIKAKEAVTDKEKQDAIDAVTRGANAEIAAIDAQSTIPGIANKKFNGSIDAGMNFAGLSRQVFGGGGDQSGKRLEDLRKIGMDTNEILKRIERGIAGVGTLQ